MFRTILETRAHGATATAAALLRVVTGFFFIGAGIGKFVEHAHEVEEFERFGFSSPDTIVYLIGVVEIGGGLLLVLGLLTRLAALMLAGNMVGAISTAGVKVGGAFHLGVAPTLLLIMLFLVWAGSGPAALDNRLVERLPDG